MVDVPIIAPDGTSGTAPAEALPRLLAKGYTQPLANAVPPVSTPAADATMVPIIAPDGTTGTAPETSLQRLLAKGYKQPADVSSLIDQAEHPATAEVAQEQKEPTSPATENADNIDLTPDGKIRLINKYTGTEHTVSPGDLDYSLKNNSDYLKPSDLGPLIKEQRSIQRWEHAAKDWGMGNVDVAKQKLLESEAANPEPQGEKEFVNPQALAEAVANGTLSKEGAAKLQAGPQSAMGELSDTGPYADIPRPIRQLMLEHGVPKEEYRHAATAIDNIQKNHLIAGIIGSSLQPEQLALMGLGGEAGTAAKTATKVALEGTEAATAISTKIAASAASNLAQSAVIAAPQLASQAIVDKDPAGAAENLLLMTGGGIVLDGILGIASKALGGAKGIFNKVVGADRNELLNTWGQSIDAGKDFFEKTVPEKEEIFKGFHNELGLSARQLASKLKKSQIADLIEEKLATRGTEIGDTYKQLDSFKGKPDVAPEAVNALSARDKMVHAAQESLSGRTATEAIDQGVHGLPQDSHIIPGKTILPQLAKLALENVGTDVSKVDSLIKNITKATDKDGILTFSKAHQIVSDLGKIERKTADAAVAYTYNQMRSIVRNELMNKATLRAAALAKPDLMEKLAIANNGYRYLNVADPGKLRSMGLQHYLQPAANHGGVGVAGHLVGAAVGNVLGGEVGGAFGEDEESKKRGKELGHGIGTVLGFGLSMGLGKWARMAMARSGDRRLAAAMVEPASAIIESSSARQQLMSKIPQVIKTLGTAGYSSQMRDHLEMTKEDEATKHMLGETANGMSKQKQAEIVQQAVQHLVNNPDAWKMQKDEITRGFEKYPALVNSMNTHLDNVLNTLAQFVPPAKEPTLPFQQDKPQQFSDTQLDKLNMALHYAQHPQAVLMDLHNGTLTPEKVQLAMMLNPNLTSMIKAEVAAQGKKPLSEYGQRLQMSLLLGMPIAEGLTNSAHFQASWATVGATPAQQGAPAPAHKPREGHKLQTPQTGTMFQRSAAGNGAK